MTAMSSTSDDNAMFRQLRDAASEPYRQAGSFAWHFARGKLGRDPVFRHLIEQGLIGAGDRVVDIGCGQGLLASLLRTAGDASTWPNTWAQAPRGVRVMGIELMPRDVERARQALGMNERVQFVCGDMCHTPFPACDAVVVLDVLHYVPHDAQDGVLRRVHEALAPGGRLLLRIGNAQQRRAYAISQWVDRVVTRVRGHHVAPTYGRSLAEWTHALERIGFAIEARPMSRGTPFANVLLVCRKSVDQVH